MRINNTLVRRAAVALGVLGLVVTAVATATHIRPKGATPIRVSLVPAFKQCTAPNRTHGGPLAFPSCAPPVQTSNYLTVGTPDANGAPANSVGFFTMKAKVTSPANVLLRLDISDVRCKPGTSASVCSGANAADGPDYSGTLEGNAMIRITDHYNGPNLNEAATVTDIPMPINAPCVNTADTSIGGFCSTTFNPGVGVAIPQDDLSGRRTVVEVTQLQVFDGGADGQPATNDNTLFMTQGIFIP